MTGRVKMIITATILLSIVSSLLLIRFYPPLNRKLFGGEIPISIDEIQFWVKKVPNRSYHRIYARYLKNPIELPDFGHGIFFADADKEKIGGLKLFFSSENNKIYGGGGQKVENGNGNYTFLGKEK